MAKEPAYSAGDADTWVQSLGQENPLEKKMATHSCSLAWEIPWTEEPGGSQSLGSQKSPTRLTETKHQQPKQWNTAQR